MAHKMVPDEEIAFKGMGALFTAVGTCSSLSVLVLMAAAAAIGCRLVDPENQSI
jgi:hypothetical protein